MIIQQLIKFKLTLILKQSKQLSNRQPVQFISKQELQEFNDQKVDSTGINLWPAEEFMAYHLVQNFQDFQGKNICELGSGYSGLAAMAVAFKNKEQKNIKILVTDGNQVCSQNLLENINLNQLEYQYFTKLSLNQLQSIFSLIIIKI